ncbi:hypothetical protein [Desulfobacula sp.]|uniref:hypothetical protein n=1 Tax=Desulfobacula sp. TaxID=2593537 RepID=UPI0025BDE646|nr:hypothetical protein [Desulfobacula sp.]
MIEQAIHVINSDHENIYQTAHMISENEELKKAVEELKQQTDERFEIVFSAIKNSIYKRQNILSITCFSAGNY